MAVRTLEETERNQILKILSETRWRIEGKDGWRNVPPARSSVPHPTFCGQDFLDIQDRNSYTSSHKKEVLIKQHLSRIYR